MLDHEKQIYEYEKTLAQLKEQNEENAVWSEEEIRLLEKKLVDLKQNVYSKLTPWERVMISRHPNRPRSVDFIRNICDEFVEIFGDRSFRDDHSIVTGFGTIEGQKVVIVAQEKGCDTESRLFRNFGMTYPEGYRKAMRAMKLAEKFNIPVLSLIDTPGAYPGLEAEERGQGRAIAENLYEMARLKTPMISIVIGEGCSGGALGIGVTDKIAMLEHAYYSVISPEGCASILYKDASKNEIASESLKMQAEDLLELGIVDHVIAEPMGGAHHDPTSVYRGIKEYFLKEVDALGRLEVDELLESRYQKFRGMGVFTTA